VLADGRGDLAQIEIVTLTKLQYLDRNRRQRGQGLAALEAILQVGVNDRLVTGKRRRFRPRQRGRLQSRV
jgi:hypothetical protein